MLQVLQNVSESLVTVMIDGGAHHLDLRFKSFQFIGQLSLVNKGLRCTSCIFRHLFFASIVNCIGNFTVLFATYPFVSFSVLLSNRM